MNSKEPINTNFNAVNPAFSNSQTKNDKKSEKKADPNRNKKRYSYKVKDNTGKIVSDYFDAEKRVLLAIAKDNGYSYKDIQKYVKEAQIQTPLKKDNVRLEKTANETHYEVGKEIRKQ